MRSAAPNTTNPLTNSPKTCIANSIPFKKHPTACSKQSGCKKSPLLHSSTFPLGDEPSSNLKHHSITSYLSMAEVGCPSNIAPMSKFISKNNTQTTKIFTIKQKNQTMYNKPPRARNFTIFCSNYPLLALFLLLCNISAI